MQFIRVAVAALTFSGIAGALHAQTASPRVFTPGEESAYPPPVDVWLDQDRYDYGTRVRPYVVTEPGAYVTIIRVTTDGEMRVLYPRRPGLQKPYEIGQLANDRVPYGDDETFKLQESQGTGFVFAIASYERFDYRYYTFGGDWSRTRLASNRYGDPFEVVRRFVEETLNERADYTMDYASYEVVSNRIRSRYASRYANYGMNDYFERCLSAFGINYVNYCRSYNSYFGPGIFVNSQPSTQPATGPKRMRIKPLVPDPMVPREPSELQPPAEGRLPASDAAERAALARHERMLRSATPKIETIARPAAEPRASEPAPRIYRDPAPRPSPRSEPQRAEPQRAEPRRAEPQAAPRVEARAEPRPAPPPAPRAEPARVVEKAQKDN